MSNIKKTTKQCKVCEKEYEPIHPIQKFCSATCKRKNDLKRYRRNYYGIVRPTPEPKPCGCCKTTFQPRRANQFYCSTECRDKQHILRRSGASETSAWKHNTVKQARVPVPKEISRQAVIVARTNVDRALKRVGLA